MSDERWMYRNYSMVGEFIDWSVAPLASLQGELSVGYLHESNVRELRAELAAERERADRAEAREAGYWQQTVEALTAERDALRERVARLVGALEQIAQLDYTRGAVNMAATKAVAIARTALGDK